MEMEPVALPSNILSFSDLPHCLHMYFMNYTKWTELHYEIATCWMQNHTSVMAQ